MAEGRVARPLLTFLRRPALVPVLVIVACALVWAWWKDNGVVRSGPGTDPSEFPYGRGTLLLDVGERSPEPHVTVTWSFGGGMSTVEVFRFPTELEVPVNVPVTVRAGGAGEHVFHYGFTLSDPGATEYVRVTLAKDRRVPERATNKQ